MNPNQIFWTYAFLTMAAIVALLGLAVRAGRRRRAVVHRRYVLGSVAVAALFIAAYAGKVAWLGREDKSDWSSTVLTFLYVHETLVLVMLITGGFAAVVGRRIFAAHTGGTAGEAEAAGRIRHARFGYACLVAAALAFATGSVVYAGLLLR